MFLLVRVGQRREEGWVPCVTRSLDFSGFRKEAWGNMTVEAKGGEKEEFDLQDLGNAVKWPITLKDHHEL